jgi:hypothetical protein
MVLAGISIFAFCGAMSIPTSAAILSSPECNEGVTTHACAHPGTNLCDTDALMEVQAYNPLGKPYYWQMSISTSTGSDYSVENQGDTAILIAHTFSPSLSLDDGETARITATIAALQPLSLDDDATATAEFVCVSGVLVPVLLS